MRVKRSSNAFEIKPGWHWCGFEGKQTHDLTIRSDTFVSCKNCEGILFMENWNAYMILMKQDREFVHAS